MRFIVTHQEADIGAGSYTKRTTQHALNRIRTTRRALARMATEEGLFSFVYLH